MKRITILLCLSLGACSTTWYKDGATQADFDRESYACERDGYAAGGSYIYGNRYSMSAMPTMNQRIYDACMRAHGWYTKG